MHKRRNMTKKETLSVVIPFYNESERLDHFLEQSINFTVSPSNPFTNFEWILINDGSTDQSQDILESFQQELEAEPKYRSRVRIIKFNRNRGKGAALKQGVELAEGSWVLTVDADFATPPSQTIEWFNADQNLLSQTNKIHIGSREHAASQTEDHQSRKILGRVFNSLIQFSLGIYIKDTQCGFKLYPSKVAKTIFPALKTTGWAHDVEIIARAHAMNIAITEQPISWKAVDGSKINPIRDSIAMFCQLMWMALVQKSIGFLKRHQGWKLLHMFSLFACILATACIYSDYGISWDETVQHEYGKKVFHWYTSFFSDKSAASFHNLYLYGGGFEVWMGMIDEVFKPKDISPIRHLFTALISILGGLGAAKTASLICRHPRAGYFTFVVLMLNPIYLGHSFMNSKDIPFASAFIWSIYFLIKLVQHLPSFSLVLAFQLACCIGWALSIRIGGILLYFYMALAWMVKLYHFKDDKKNLKKSLNSMKKYAQTTIPISYLIMLVFWPWAAQSWWKNPIKAFFEVSKFNWIGPIFFDGQFVMSNQLPWFFIPKLLLIQNSEIYIAGLCTLLISLFLRHKSHKEVYITGLLLFFASFPVLYVILSKAVLYDNFRHLLFIIPIFAVLSGMGLENTWSYMRKKSFMIQFTTKAAIGIAVSLPVLSIISLHPYQYTYFNTFSGGQHQGLKNFENDYWATSYKELMEKLEANLRHLNLTTPFKIHALGPTEEVKKHCASSPFLNYTEIFDKADLVVALNRQGIASQVEGEEVVSVERFGVMFSIVKKRTNIKKHKNIHLSQR